MSNASERWSSAPAPIETKKETRKAEFRLIESEGKETEVKIGVATEASPDHPLQNQDSYTVSEKRGDVVIADGVGGGLAGDIGSMGAVQELTLERLATRDIMTRLVMEADREEPMVSKEDVEDAVRQTMMNMNDAVIKLQMDPAIIAMARKRAEARLKGKRKLDPSDVMDRQLVMAEARSMSCTASLSKIWRDAEGKDWSTIAHVGDSRIYRLRKDRLERLTPDHSIVQEIIDLKIPDENGKPIEDDQDVTRVVTREALRKHVLDNPGISAIVGQMVLENTDKLMIDDIRHYVLQTLGTPASNKRYYKEDLKPFIRTDELEDGDVELVCSDGLSDVLTDDEIQAVLIRLAEEPLKAAQELLQLAAARSQTQHIRAKPDDITVIVRRFKKKKKVEEA